MKLTLFVSEKWNSHTIKMNNLCVLVWEVVKDAMSFLGNVTEALLNNCNFLKGHLYRTPRKQKDFWKYPTPENVQTVSIVFCKVDGE